MKNRNTKYIAYQVRKRILELGYAAGKDGAHFGSSLSLVDVLVCVYDSFFKDKLEMRDHQNRDRFILSKGHGALGYFCILENFGYLDKNHTSKFEQNGTNLFAHAHKNLSHGIEYSGGSLGLGLSFGVGIALANRMKDLDPKIIVLVGDGECDEGIVWESLMSISNFNLDNFLVIVDRNKMQSDGEKIQIMDQKDIALKFKSFGFDVCEIDGHDHQQIKEALNQNQTCPKAIIANTIKGKGIGFMESNSNWHHGYLNENLFNEALEDLEKGYG